MSLSNLLNIGKSALFTNQTSLNVTSHNIANVNTPHFSRQETILEISSPARINAGFIGRGVTVSNIKRNYDSFLAEQLLQQKQQHSKTAVLESGFSQLEEILNEYEDTGVSGRLKEYFNAWQEVANNPQSQEQRTVLLQNAANLAAISKETEERIEGIIDSHNKEIPLIIDNINSLAQDIARLNERITQFEGGNSLQEANDLRDTRDKLLSNLNSLVNVETLEDDSGMVTVIVGQRNLVQGAHTHLIEGHKTVDNTFTIKLDNIDITERITKGRLSGLLELRNTINSGPLKDLRKTIASLTIETNELHQNGYGLDSSNGLDFFSPLNISTRDFSLSADIASAAISDFSTLTLHEYDINFSAGGNYEIYDKDLHAVISSGTYDGITPIVFDGIEIDLTAIPEDGSQFFISPLEDAIKNFGVTITDSSQVAAAGADPVTVTGPGDNENTLEIISLYEGNISDLGNNTFNEFYDQTVVTTGILSSGAKDSLTFEENLLHETEERMASISGVSLDEEAANLIKYQKSYEAGARLISITDELFDVVLNL